MPFLKHRSSPTTVITDLAPQETKLLGPSPKHEGDRGQLTPRYETVQIIDSSSAVIEEETENKV